VEGYLHAAGVGLLRSRPHVPRWTRSEPVLFASATLFGVAVLISHRPDVVLHAQLWGDDGKKWLFDAYTYGLGRVFLPYEGYLGVFQGVAAAGVLLAPLSWAPLLFALVALAVQSLPFAFLATDRLALVVPRRYVRVLAGVACLSVPTIIELLGTLTNTQWSLAVLAALVVAAPRVRGWSWRIFDFMVVLLSGLSGPFCIFLLLPAAGIAWRRRSSSQWALTWCVLATSLIQGVAIAASAGLQRPALLTPVMPSAVLGLKLLVDRMALVPIVGANSAYRASGALPLWGDLALGLAIAGVFAGALAIASAEMRLLLTFGLLVLAGTLIASRTTWAQMLHPYYGERYWFIPMLAWLLALTLLAARRRARLVGPACAAAIVLFAVLAAPAGWLYPSLPNPHFQRSVLELESARPGQSVDFGAEDPGWRFQLTRKS